MGAMSNNEHGYYKIFYFLHFTTSDEVYQNSTDICKTCGCNDKVEFILDCREKHFEHVLANWPPHNKTLVGEFSYNNITTLEKLPITDQRAKLLFDNCRIQYLDSGVFSNMKNVEFIDLSFNLLTTEEIGAEDFRGPYDEKKYRPLAVKYLNLAYNQIHSLQRKFFEYMPDLEELYLQGNDFTVIDQTTQVALGSLTKIRVLNLANNELTEIEGNLVRNLHTLKELDLSSNHLDFVPSTLSYMAKNLQILNLSNNYIFELSDQSFIGLDLTELYLNHLNRLKNVEANTFATLKNLKKLHLRGNEVLTVIDKEAFGEKQILNELDIRNNSLSDIDYKMLNWSKLTIFRISLNPLRCSCDLYNISQDLTKTITQNKEKPTCYDEDSIIPVYTLDSSICNKDKSLHISKATLHFNKIRIAFITLSSILLIVTAVAVVVGVLRYRKTFAFKNYPFSASQVSYLPIQTQHI